MSELNQARNRVYQLLSALFAKEIDPKLRHELISQPAQDFWQQFATQPAFSADVKEIQAALNTLTSQADLLELAADYCGLFLVGSKHSASPYASLYTGESEVTIFGEEHQQMMNYLRQHQLQLTSDFAEPADHIAVILAYAGHLSLNASEQDQLQFLQRYLASWIEPFVNQVIKTDQGRFYSALARLTSAWLSSEIHWLETAS